MAAIGNVSSRRPVAIALALATFVLAGYLLYILPMAGGADLAPLIIAARLIAGGDIAAIYPHSTNDIDIFDDHVWVAAADSIGYAYGRYYSYLYPPLWPALLAPLVCRISFASFLWIGAVSNIAAIGLSIVITAAQWNRAMLRPLPLLLTLAALVTSYPLFKTVLLGQIQPLVVLLVVIAISASQNERPILAGSALALAAAIKIVPACIALYWLFNRRRDCAAWFAAGGALLLAASLGLTGWEPHFVYLRALGDLSGGYVVDLHNQSLVAWLGEGVHVSDRTYTMPVRAAHFWVRAAVDLLAVSCSVWLIRSAPTDKAAEALALFALLLVATIAAPLAWLHYFFMLAVPLIILARDILLRLCAAAIAMLLSLPAVLYLIANDIGRSSPLTWGGTIASLAVLILSALYIRRTLRQAAGYASVATGASAALE